MTTTYNPTTAKKAIGWLANESVTGLSLPEDCEELYDILNSIREFLYNQYHRIKLFDNYITCHDIQCYPVDCNNPCDRCDDFYYGITVPSDMAGIEEAWYNLSPLRTRSRWFEGREGIQANGYKSIYYGSSRGGYNDGAHKEYGSLIPIDQDFATEHPLKSCSHIQIHSSSRCDDDKEFLISGKIKVQRGDEEEIESFTVKDKLKGRGTKTTNVPFMSIDSIQMPDDLVGHVRITDTEGNLLSRIDRGDCVPRYKRYKLLIDECDCQYRYYSEPNGHVALKGTREFREIFNDTDIVEIGSKRVIQQLARMLRKEDADDPNERDTAEYNRVKAMDELRGLVERYHANEKQDRPKRFNRHKKYRLQRWRR